MVRAQEEIRIGLMGPTRAGKTNLFETFGNALTSGRHGFPKACRPRLTKAADAKPVAGLTLVEIRKDRDSHKKGPQNSTEWQALAGNTPPTSGEQPMVTRAYDLAYSDLHDQRREKAVRLIITDAAGEHTFSLTPPDESTLEYRYDVAKELGRCQGFVVVVPLASANDGWILQELEHWLADLSASAESGPSKEPRRVVIALTRYDAMFTDFGCEALRLAADPKVAVEIVSRFVRKGGNGISYRNNLLKFDHSAGGAFRISFVPTSSFGFVPGFGCVNLDPAGAAPEDIGGLVASGSSPPSFKVRIEGYPDNQFLFPFLTADPFIFAATGLANPFIVPIDRALGEMASDTDEMASQSGGVSDWPDGGAGLGSGDRFNGGHGVGRDDHAVRSKPNRAAHSEPKSWFASVRSKAKAIKEVVHKIDLDL
jgi:hypothetical protein